MKLALSVLLLTTLCFSAAPQMALAEDVGEELSCANDVQCQNDKIDTLIAQQEEQERLELKRKPAQADDDFSCANDVQCQHDKIDALLNQTN